MCRLLKKQKAEKLRIARIVPIQSTGPRIFENGDPGEEPGKAKTPADDEDEDDGGENVEMAQH